MEWQKTFVRIAYEAVKNNEELIYIPPRGSSSFQLRTLESLVILEVAQERGLVKLDLDKEKKNDRI